MPTKTFTISGDKHYIQRVIDSPKLVGVTSVKKLTDTSALIEYDADLTDLSTINQNLRQFRVKKAGGSK